MKRTLLATAVFLLASTIHAQTAPRTYVVATRTAFHGHLTPFHQDDPDITLRNVEAFQSVNGFSAQLTDDEAAQLRKSPDVVSVRPAVERHAFSLTAEPDATRNVNGQTVAYGIDLVHARDVWPVAKGQTINVVVMDTGIDYNHPDLHDIYAGGYNTIKKTNDPMDDNGHGTHCAGIIAAEDNNIGVVGVAPDVKIWSVKVLDKSGSGSDTNIIAGIDWVLNKKLSVGGDWVMSLSLGAQDSDDLEEQAFQRLSDAGVLVVAATGNHDPTADDTPDNFYEVAYPAAYPTVLAIGAVDSTSTIADFSNQGSEVALVAPGVDVLSTLPIGTGALSQVTSGGASYDAVPLTGSPKGTISGQYVYCGLGNPQDFPTAVKGNIALIKRGTLTFHDKVKNALTAGATAVVIFNSDTSALSFTLIGQSCDINNKCTDNAADLAFAWPVTLSISLADGQTLQNSSTNTLTAAYLADDYGVESGTSMATPHAAGTAALVWSVAPNATAAQVSQALIGTAQDLGTSGLDSTYGNGLVNALAAAKQLSPSSFNSGASNPPAEPPSGRRILKRGH